MAHKSEAKKSRKPRELLDIVEDVAVYPIEAYQFIQEGLNYACERFHPEQSGSPDSPSAAKKASKAATSKPAEKPKRRPPEDAEEEPSRHITGRQLSEGLREYAWLKWGLMARTVLSRWNITSTMDFGKIVYALIDAQILSKNDSDRIDDFRAVYDFRTLDACYVLPPQPAAPEVPDPSQTL